MHKYHVEINNALFETYKLEFQVTEIHFYRLLMTAWKFALYAMLD